MRIYQYTTILLLIFLMSCYDKDSLVDSISELNIVMCEYVGFAGSKSDGYKNFERLKSIATKDELIELTKHDSLAVVTYATYALLDKELVKPSDLVKQHLYKKDYVATFCGCIGMRESLASLIYDRYRDPLISILDEYDYENYEVNDTEELLVLDSLILTSDIEDEFLIGKVLKNRQFNKEYLPLIQKWAFDKRNIYAQEYLFINHKEGNEERLFLSLSKTINSQDIYEGQRKYLECMIEELKRRDDNNE